MQSSTKAQIHNAFFALVHTNNVWYNNTHTLIKTTYLTIIASKVSISLITIFFDFFLD